MFQLEIQCLACGSTKATGQLPTLPDLTEEQVLADALHNPGCPVPDPDGDPSRISINTQDNNPTMVYTITYTYPP